MEYNYNHYPSPSCFKTNSGSSKKSGRRQSSTMRLSTDPQSVAARERRHRISDRFKILQSMVPGGTKMDTVSMLDEAIQYVKFLKAQILLHRSMMVNNPGAAAVTSFCPSQYDDHFLAAAYNNNNADDDNNLLPPLPPQPPLVQMVPEYYSSFHTVPDNVTSYCYDDAYTIDYN